MVRFLRKLKLIRTVDVDDFKPVGKKSSMKEGWKLITDSGLVLDPPTPLGDHLGCGQFPVQFSPAEAQRRLEHVRPLLADVEGQNQVKTNQPVKAIRCNIPGFFRQCFDAYCDLANIDPKTLRKVATPGMDDHQLKPEAS